MNATVLSVAAEVIRRSGPDRPADAVLRQVLRTRRLAPSDSSEVAATVFAYYRWFGWMESEAGLTRNLAQGRELAAVFESDSASIPEDELVQRALPKWAVEQIPAEKLPALCKTLQRPPVLWLRARVGQGNALALSLGSSRVAGNGVSGDCVRYKGRKDLFLTDEFHHGRFELQDINSQAVGWICAPEAGETWWDVCAGEGGKTLHLADLMGNRGLIWATDRAAWRLARLKRRAARAGVFNYRQKLWGGEGNPPMRTRFDGILVDAPCSGLGTWRRNPQARWTTTPAGISELGSIQERLLTQVAPALKIGGRLIYAVCTMTPRETSQVADEFEAAASRFERLVFPNPVRPGKSAEGRLQIWPQDNDGNGMFVAAWRKTG